jgi:3-oxoadipate enol-lactonase
MTTDRPPLERSDDFDRGVANRRAVLGDEWVDRSLAGASDFNADFQSLITRYAWHEIWGRPGLDHETRRLLVLGMTMGLARWEEFELHCRAAIRSGVPLDRIKETLLQGAIYCGVPAANTAFKITGEILRAEGRAPAPRSLAADSRVATHHTFSAPQLRVTVQGQGPAVVLSHALGLDLHMWDELAARLATSYTVLRYDHRGHGESARPLGPYSTDDLVDDAARLIREWGRGPVAFVGLSMGGMVGQGLAVRHPELLRGAVLANTVARYPGSGAADVGGADRRGRGGRHGGGRRCGRRALPARRLSRRAPRRRRRPARKAASRRPCRLRPRAATPSPPSTGSTGWRPCGCRRSSSPARATPARRRSWPRAIAERIAGAELRVFADASHLSVVEVGDEFHGAVSSFLASLPPR